mmetsp:Transcript_96100/g.311787  ORF Transcript_96100/g.311787 Transcript_96100/m.311787 type:complete len:423 (-) Transcript_96100:49-1317(-)
MIVRLVASTAALCTLAAPLASGFAPPRTFGNGVLEYARNSTFKAHVVLNHTLHEDSAYGVVSHFWETGELINYELVIDVFVDGEGAPSISFQPGMASGQGYPKEAGGLELFEAGGKMGKASQIGGWYNYHKVIFRRSVRMEVRTLGGQQAIYMVVRGFEVAKGTRAAEGLRLPSGFVVPPHAKLQLLRIDNVTYRPLDTVPLVQLPSGYAGVVYLTSLATATVPAGNGYTQGCLQFYGDVRKQMPAVVLATSLSELFLTSDRACTAHYKGGSPCLFAHSAGGVLHFSQLLSNGSQARPPFPADSRERMSAYRFFDDEVLGFQDGGWLQWHVGDARSSTCASSHDVDTSGYLREPANSTSAAAVAVRSYVWVYTWPLDAERPPAPNSPPIPCEQPLVCGPPTPEADALEPLAADVPAAAKLRK